MSKAAEDAGMRAALSRSWYAFFARFPEPTEVQRAVWRPLLDGRDVLIASPTASGKTEAFMAPLLERYLDRRDRSGPKIVVVSPTRALVNDLLRRLEGPIASMGLAVLRRTGDHGGLQTDPAPAVLLTTPESLDSVLVRHATYYSGLLALVLDEVHVLDGTARGDQLRLLVSRLRALRRSRGGQLQVVVSSATIEEPETLAPRYLENATIVAVGGSRRLQGRTLSCGREGDLLAALAAAWGVGVGRSRKILVFVSSRARVEELSSRLREQLGSRVFAHHGSLSREERERVEERFLQERSAICFATMTLELGIDIGDVDLVALADVPSSVASFLQRIGRGNRRSGGCRVLCLARNAGDRARYRHLGSLAKKGVLLAPGYRFRPSVLVQQIGSLLLQSKEGWLTPEIFASRLPPQLAASFSLARLDELFAHLVGQGWLVLGRAGRYSAGDKLIETFERRHLHGNFGLPQRTVQVMEESTGRSLGEVLASDEDQGESIALGGQRRDVLRERDGVLFVAAARGEAKKTRFAPRGRPMVGRELALSLGRHAGWEAGRLRELTLANGWAVLHFQGSLAGELLGFVLHERHGWSVSSVGAFALRLDHPLPAVASWPVQRDDLEKALVQLEARLGRMMGVGPFHRYLPEPWRREFLREAIPCGEIADTWSRATALEQGKPDALLEALACVR